MAQLKENAMFNRKNLFAAASLALAIFPMLPNMPAYAALPDNSTLGTGAPLEKGMRDNNQLGDLIHASLLRDPSGNSKLDAAACRANGSCATPNTYLVAITQTHPKVAERLKTVAQLEMYIRGLTKVALSGNAEWFSARMIGDTLDITSGFHRMVAVGEMVYQDTQTGDYVFLGNCGNVMWPAPAESTEIAVTFHCVKVHYMRPAGATGIRYANYGGTEVPNSKSCPYTISEGGQPPIPLSDTENCPPIDNVVCDVETVIESEIAKFPDLGLSSAWERKGSMPLTPQPGVVEDVIQMPISVVKEGTSFLICPFRIDAAGHIHEYGHGSAIHWHKTDRIGDYTLSNFNASS